MSMKARKIRQRSVTLADDDVQDESAAEAVRKSVAARKQQKDKKGSQKPQLSFDDDEEIHFAPVKRPPAKLKPDLKGLKLASDSAKTSTQRSAPGGRSGSAFLPDMSNESSLHLIETHRTFQATILRRSCWNCSATPIGFPQASLLPIHHKRLHSQLSSCLAVSRKLELVQQHLR